jgi:hypothetical protein
MRLAAVMCLMIEQVRKYFAAGADVFWTRPRFDAVFTEDGIVIAAVDQEQLELGRQIPSGHSLQRESGL